jgi:hypothetical protein
LTTTATSSLRLRLTLTSLLALLGCLAAAACTQSEWREMEISEGGFSVLMRGDPHYLRQDLETPAGKMAAHLYSSDRPESYFAVGYSDYPLALIVGAQPDQLFNSVRDTWVRRIKGRLVASDNTIKLAGKYPGMEFSAEGSDPKGDTFVQSRLFLVDQRLYQLVAMGRKGEVPQGTVNRFLNSFRLVPVSETGTIKIEPAAK